MPRDLSELTVGEQWAYRAKRTEPLACVESHAAWRWAATTRADQVRE